MVVVWLCAGLWLYGHVGLSGWMSAILGLFIAAAVGEVYLRLLYRYRVRQVMDRQRNLHRYL
jgi:uncharacterized membrane-anchored protein YhcB (DUF1043 family)